MRIEVNLPENIVKIIDQEAKKEIRTRKGYLEYLILKHIEKIQKANKK